MCHQTFLLVLTAPFSPRFQQKPNVYICRSELCKNNVLYATCRSIVLQSSHAHFLHVYRTTTIGKLAYRLRTEGNQTVMMAACDTFRAGAVEQLAQWAERAEVDIVGPSETATSPSAVLFNALDKAIKEKYDTVLVDTTGRLSNNDALTKELAKMKKVIQKRLSIEKDEEGNNTLNTNVPHETLLVLDAAQGRMALDSARIWNEEIGLTGLVLTKLDGSARGGSVVAVSRDLKLPVKLIGVGEGIEDLRDVSRCCMYYNVKTRTLNKLTNRIRNIRQIAVSTGTICGWSSWNWSCWWRKRFGSERRRCHACRPVRNYEKRTRCTC